MFKLDLAKLSVLDSSGILTWEFFSFRDGLFLRWVLHLVAGAGFVTYVHGDFVAQGYAGHGLGRRRAGAAGSVAALGVRPGGYELP